MIQEELINKLPNQKKNDKSKKYELEEETHFFINILADDFYE